MPTVILNEYAYNPPTFSYISSGHSLTLEFDPESATMDTSIDWRATHTGSVREVHTRFRNRETCEVSWSGKAMSRAQAFAIQRLARRNSKWKIQNLPILYAADDPDDIDSVTYAERYWVVTKTSISRKAPGVATLNVGSGPEAREIYDYSITCVLVRDAPAA